MEEVNIPAFGGPTLYMSIDEAAAWAGIGKQTMRDYANSQDPPPMLIIGNVKRIQRAKLPAYLERKQQVKEA